MADALRPAASSSLAVGGELERGVSAVHPAVVGLCQAPWLIRKPKSLLGSNMSSIAPEGGCGVRSRRLADEQPVDQVSARALAPRAASDTERRKYVPGGCGFAEPDRRAQ